MTTAKNYRSRMRRNVSSGLRRQIVRSRGKRYWKMTRLLDGRRHADGVFIGDGCVLSFAQTAFNSEVAVISPAFATEPTLSRRLLVALGGHPRALN